MAMAQPEPQLLQRAGAAAEANHLCMKVIERLAQEGHAYM
jgi:hypothetical protein